MAAAKFLFVVILALAAFANAQALKCYQCDMGKECESDEDNLKACLTDELACFIVATDNKNETFTRGCAADKKFCDGKKEIACGTCQKDGCNSANALSATAIGIAAIFALRTIL